MELKCDKHNFDMNGTLITPNKRLRLLPNFRYNCNGVLSRKKDGTKMVHDEPLVIEHHGQKC